MRIAAIAPLYESVPPRGYGGTERVVHWLVEALVREGHELTLFASGDSETSARLIPIVPRSLRSDKGCADPLAHHVRMVEEVFRRAGSFDLLHFHTDYVHYPLSLRSGLPFLTTLHGRLDLPDLAPLYRTFSRVPVVSISDAQRRPLPWLRWEGTVLHGMPEDLLPFDPRGGEDLVFLGRISPEKRPDRAIEIAERAGRRLWIAAKVDRSDRDYFEHVRPLLRRRGVEFLGEIGEVDKAALLGMARALLFPVDWPEPFGLVMIESMACGTPVVAWPHGSVPEIVDDGITGFLVRDVEAAVRAVEAVDTLSRARVRARFEERFKSSRMAQDYLRIYRRLAAHADRKNTFPSEAGASP